MVFDFNVFYKNPFIQKILTAVVILFLGMIIAKLVQRFLKKILHELDINRMTGNILRLNSEKLISNLSSNIIYLLTFVSVLNILNITGYVWRGILIFLIFLIVSDLILHIKDLIPNFIGYLKIKNKIKVDDTIKTDLIEGKVRKISFLNVKIKTKENDVVYLPNNTLVYNLSIK